MKKEFLASKMNNVSDIYMSFRLKKEKEREEVRVAKQ